MAASKLEEAYKIVREAEKKALEDARKRLVKMRDDIGEPLTDVLKEVPTVPGPRSEVFAALTNFDAALRGWPGQIDNQIAQIDQFLAHYKGYDGGTSNDPQPVT